MIRPTRNLVHPLRRLLIGAAAVLLVTVTLAAWQAQAVSSNSTASAISATWPNLERWQALLQRAPNNHYAMAQFGLAQLQMARVTADPARYVEAEAAFARVLAADPGQIDALVGQGMLALSRHDFAGALEWADKAGQVNPFRADVLGIRVDSLVELGRYAEAVDAAQEMVNLRPGLEAYSRIAYLRELHGDVDGAIVAMQAAADAGVPNEERTLWSQVQVGNLYLGRGDLTSAESSYQAALRADAGYLPALAGLAKVDAAQGDYRRAIRKYEQVVALLPLPGDVIALGELYLLTGQENKATEQFKLASALRQLNAAAGMDVDLELALFLANHGDAVQRADAETLAKRVYAQRATIYTADTLAWSLYRNGNAAEAWPYSQEARALGTQDALLTYRGAMIAAALGQPEEAQELAQRALAINPALMEPIATELKGLIDQ